MKLMIRLLFILVTLFTINITVYAYTEYKIGDIVPYNGMEFYVIKDSSSKDDSVTMLKKEPLSVDEVNQFGRGHVNMYNCQESETSCYHTAYDYNGYGGMAYYTSVDCGYGTGSNHTDTGCKSDYASSEVKYVVDAWKNAKVPEASEARLLTYEEASEYTETRQICTGNCYEGIGLKYDWMYNSNYWYWLGTPYTDSSFNVWRVGIGGDLYGTYVGDANGVIRPVITLSKIALGDEDKSITDDKDIKKQSENKSSDNKKETITKVKVENTYKSQTLIIMIIGFISICSGVVIYYLIKNNVISRR